MLSEILMHFIGLPLAAAAAGLMGGAVTGLFTGGAEAVKYDAKCQTYQTCKIWDQVACIMANESVAVLDNLNRYNHSALTTLDRAAQLTGQTSFGDQTKWLSTRCDWTNANCPSAFQTGESDCDKAAYTAVRRMGRYSWIGTLAGGGLGLVSGAVMYVMERRERARNLR